MKVTIFAGGSGTRLWPLSRKNTPKQFDKIFEGKSTIQLAVERLLPLYPTEDIYISTNKKFEKIVSEQLPNISANNIVYEPDRRDVAPAILLTFMRIKKTGYSGAIAILWADHLIKRLDEFHNALKAGEKLIQENPNRFIYMGEKPTFANHNLGWINIGEEISQNEGLSLRKFKSWKYRPELELCKEMYASGKAYWNPGYFVTSVDFVLDLYKQLLPDMYKAVESFVNLDGEEYDAKLTEIYPTLESVSFDNAIIEKTSPEQAVVLLTDMGWSDPGTLYALKEALQESSEANVSKGKVYNLDTKDSLTMNFDEEKILTTIGLEGFIVVNTKDALIVVKKEDVPKVKDLVQKLEEEGFSEYI